MPWDPAPATTACQLSGSAATAEGRDLQVAVAEFCACAPCLLRKIAPQSVRLVCRWDDGDKQSIHRPVSTRSYGTRGSQATGADPWVAIHPTAWKRNSRKFGYRILHSTGSLGPKSPHSPTPKP